MVKPDEFDLDSDSELGLDSPHAESLPLHNFQHTSSGDAPVEISRIAPPESKSSRPTAFLDGLRGLASFFVYFVCYSRALSKITHIDIDWLCSTIIFPGSTVRLHLSSGD